MRSSGSLKSTIPNGLSVMRCVMASAFITVACRARFSNISSGLFNARKIPFLVCTSTIIEGVNTVAKNVIVYDRRKSKDVLEHFTYKNIEGRAGRMNQYFIGRVYVLETLPPDQSFTVEFPAARNARTRP